MNEKVIIVGAGVTGLYLGMLLKEKKPLVIEANGLGGLAGGFKIENDYLEKFYHYAYYPDIDFVNLCRECGLEDKILWLQTKSAVFSENRFWPLEKPLDFLRFKPIKRISQRLLMMWNLWNLVQAKEWESFDSITCEEFFRKRGNHEGYRQFWEPLLKLKFGESYRNIPVSFLWGRVQPRAKSRKKGVELLGYIEGGYSILFEKMKEKIEDAGGKVLTSEHVKKIEPGKEVRVITSKNEYSAKKVIWTASNVELREVCQSYRKDDLKEIKYMAALSLILILDRKLGDYFWVNIVEKMSFGILIEHTNFINPTYFGGKHIIYIGNYLERNNPLLSINQEELLDLYIPDLKKIYPHFSKEYIINKFLFKNFFATPLYDLNYSQKIPPFRGLIEGVDIVGTSQIYPPDRSLDRAIDLCNRYFKKYWDKNAVQ